MTKEELDVLMGTLRLAFRELTRGRLVLFEEREEIVATLEKLQAEFKRYIDVLEPLRELSTLSPYMTTLDYYTYVIQTLNTEHRFDCDAIVKMLRRACDLIDKPKEACSCNTITSKRWLYCPYCGRKLSNEGYHPHCGKEVG